jgi:REP element-mobilizing transposase RayT
MSVKKEIAELFGTYFITITCHNWLHLFDITKSYETVYNWFDYLKKNHHFINGYVIMPNHLHALISFSNSEKKINRIVGNGKRFMAYDLVEKLNNTNNEIMMHQLSDAVNISDKKRGKLHEVFEPSFNSKECFTEKFIIQKLDYIHFNPCVGKWNLSDCPENYIHSSAKYYNTGIQGIYMIDDIMKMLDIDLSKKILE